MLRTLKRRGIDVPGSVRDRVLATTGIDVLGVWLDRACQVADARELFGETPARENRGRGNHRKQGTE